MDMTLFVDRITAIDLQISQLREEMKPIRYGHVEGEHMQRLRQEVQRLVEQKAQLRAAFALR
jgi:hypothetical protein